MTMRPNNTSLIQGVEIKQKRKLNNIMTTKLARDSGAIVLKEGWCVKKSGNRGLLGQYKWQRRWFTLQQDEKTATLYYYEKHGAKQPKGQIQLSNKYVTREPEGSERVKPHCFEVGPFSEDGTTRTYFISCETEDDKHEWMEVMNAAIEGAAANMALQRKQTASFRAKKRKDRERVNSKTFEKNEIKRDSYLDVEWRKQQWVNLVALAHSTDWKKTDVKDGVTVCRMGFGNLPHAVIKVEGFIHAKSKHVYSFVQKAIQPGGKLDFPFRGADDILDDLTAHPRGKVLDCYKEIKILPNTQPRSVTLLQMMVPQQLTQGETCGCLVMSVNHPDSQRQGNAVSCSVGISGCVIRRQEGEEEITKETNSSVNDSDDDDEEDDVSRPEVRTHLTLLGQINLQGSLQTMLKGAYKSGLLVHGIRSFFQHLTEHIDSYVKIVDI